MTPFTTLTGIVAPLPIANIDTDQIIPARFLKTIRRTGLGQHLFADMRKLPGFVLDRPDFAGASILIAGENFGCGSSREHASWALLDHGIRCVIAPSFADIFQNNALKNGLLPVALARAACDRLIGPPDRPITVDLRACVVTTASGERFSFEVDPLRREMLLDGLDDIGVTLRYAPAIEAFEARRPPWLA